jgi:hypothetical protein
LEALTYYQNVACIFVKINCVFRFASLLCEVGGCSFLAGMGGAQNWAEIKKVSLINV